MGKANIMECCCCGNRDSKSFKQFEQRYICGCCGVAFYFEDDENISNEEKRMLERGYANLKNYEFQKARREFSDVLRDYPKSIDARWGFLLSKYGVVFIKGFFDGVVEPIYCFPEYDELSNKMFRGEKEYGEILELIDDDEELTDFYEKKSRKIDTAIRKYRECKNDIERDVFLCVKISAATEHSPEAQGRAEDYAFAQKIYNDLRAKGMNVFFSFVTLHNEVNSDHEIWLNLVKSKKMLLIASSEEYIESAWVKSEWKRWLFLGRHEDMYICSMRHDYQNPKSILPHELRTMQIYTLDTYDKLISDISGETAAEEERARLEAEQRAKKAEELRKQAEIEDRLRWEEEMKAQFKEQLRAQAEEMERMRAEMRAAAEAEAKAKAEAEAREKAEAEAKKDGKVIYRDGREEAIAYGITEITATMYGENDTVTRIFLPKSVTKIGGYAFEDCNELLGIDIPESVTEIGDFAFQSCEKLKHVVIPASVKKIGEEAFSLCPDLKVNISPENKHYKVIDNNIYSIDGKTIVAYITKSNETSFSVPYGVTAIDNSAFSLSRTLTNIVIPSSVTSIGNYAFSDCDNLLSIDIPKSVKTIGKLAFYCCGKLARVTIPYGITKIGDDVFDCCDSLKDIYYGGTKEQWQKIAIGESNDVLAGATMHFTGESAESGNLAAQAPSKKDGSIVYKNGKTEVLRYGITEISEKAYYKHDEIVSVVLPESVKSIGNLAFALCKSLVNITIPKSVTSVGDSAFSGCASIKSVYYNGTKEQWETITIGIFNDRLTEAYYGVKAAPSYIVKESSVSSQKTVDTPGTKPKQSDLRDGKIVYKNGKTEVLRYGITEISEKAYYKNDEIVSVVLPESVKSIGNLAFALCKSLASITIPKSVTSVGDSAFSGCVSIKSVYYNGTKEQWKTITIGIFNDNLSEAYYGVKKASSPVISAKKNDNEKKDGEVVYKTGRVDVLRYGIRSISANAYYNNKDIIKVVLPGSVKTIEGGSPYSITAGSSFAGAFYGCSSLINVIIPDSVTTIGRGAFSCCSILTGLELPNSITTIERGAFSSCYGLKTIKIPKKITEISEGLFSGCHNLASVNIPLSVTKISNRAFYLCDGLKDIYYEGSKSDWAKIDIGKDNPKLNGLLGRAKIHFNSN